MKPLNTILFNKQLDELSAVKTKEDIVLLWSVSADFLVGVLGASDAFSGFFQKLFMLVGLVGIARGASYVLKELGLRKNELIDMIQAHGDMPTEPNAPTGTNFSEIIASTFVEYRKPDLYNMAIKIGLGFGAICVLLF